MNIEHLETHSQINRKTSRWYVNLRILLRYRVWRIASIFNMTTRRSSSSSSSSSTSDLVFAFRASSKSDRKRLLRDVLIVSSLVASSTKKVVSFESQKLTITKSNASSIDNSHRRRDSEKSNQKSREKSLIDKSILTILICALRVFFVEVFDNNFASFISSRSLNSRNNSAFLKFCFSLIALLSRSSVKRRWSLSLTSSKSMLQNSSSFLRMWSIWQWTISYDRQRKLRDWRSKRLRWRVW